MTPAEFINNARACIQRRLDRDLKMAKPPLTEQSITAYYSVFWFGALHGQPSRFDERTYYPQDGKWFMKSYKGSVKAPDGESYDAFHLWSLDGDELEFLGSHHRL